MKQPPTVTDTLKFEGGESLMKTKCMSVLGRGKVVGML